MRVIEPGHIYALKLLDSPGEVLFTLPPFIRRSSKMIDYGKGEHAGTNTQELMRLIIELCEVAADRSRYLNDVQACNETGDAISFLNRAAEEVRCALYSYEVRAFRRKRGKLNKKAGKHADDGDIAADRLGFSDIPFSVIRIEELPVGDDGHLLVKKKKRP